MLALAPAMRTPRGFNRLRTWRRILLILAILALGKASWIDVKAMMAQQLLQQAWQQTRQDQQAHKPWPWFDSQPVAALVWPDGQQHILLQGTSGQVLAFAPGLQVLDAATNSLPVSAWQQADSLLIGAHNDTHFAELENISIGAQFGLIFASGDRQRYRVVHKRVVDSRDQRLLPAHSSGGMSGQLLLITCYPFQALSASGSLRYVVTAYPL